MFHYKLDHLARDDAIHLFVLSVLPFPFKIRTLFKNEKIRKSLSKHGICSGILLTTRKISLSLFFTSKWDNSLFFSLEVVDSFFCCWLAGLFVHEVGGNEFKNSNYTFARECVCVCDCGNGGGVWIGNMKMIAAMFILTYFFQLSFSFQLRIAVPSNVNTDNRMRNMKFN